MSGTGNLVSRIYSNFRGVDFRGEEINLVRSPDSLNMWKDYKKTNSIRTRPIAEEFIGTSAFPTTFDRPIYGIFFYKGEMIIHGGLWLYKMKIGKPETLERMQLPESVTSLKRIRSNAFVFGEKWYFMDGQNYLVYDGETVKEVVGYIPTTSIGRKPEGGGTVHEDINMLSPYRTNTFVGDGKSRLYCLDDTEIDVSAITVEVDGKVKRQNDHFSVNVFKGEILFKVIDGNPNYQPPPAPKTDGQDNVKITFKKTVQGHADRIKKCTLSQVFDNRIFVSGNDAYPNVVWHCSLYDPSYWSDKDYYEEGLDSAKVNGLVAGSDALLVFREPSDANTTVFYHRPIVDDDYGGKIYPSQHTSVSIGCVGKAINFNDDIVFFSPRGMEAVCVDKLTAEQVLEHRSSLVDRKLITESGYKRMVLAEWEGYLMVFIDTKVYLADSRAVFTNEDHIEYEWFYWDLGNKNVYCATVYDGELYIGSDMGVFKLVKKDADIESYWTTPKDKFEYPHKLKTTNKRGCVVESTGDISVYAKLEDTGFEHIGTYENVTDYFVSRIKRKKFKDIQLKFHSNTSFSLETATLECFIGGYIKR